MAKEKNSKNEKNNGRSFMKDFRAELKKVVWPTSKQMVNNVVAVLTIVIITALIVFVLDLGFGAMNKYGIDKIKSNVQKNNTTTQNTDNNEIPAEGTEGENQEVPAEQQAESEADTNNVETTETTDAGATEEVKSAD